MQYTKIQSFTYLVVGNHNFSHKIPKIEWNYIVDSIQLRVACLLRQFRQNGKSETENEKKIRKVKEYERRKKSKFVKVMECYGDGGRRHVYSQFIIYPICGGRKTKKLNSSEIRSYK